MISRVEGTRLTVAKSCSLAVAGPGARRRTARQIHAMRFIVGTGRPEIRDFLTPHLSSKQVTAQRRGAGLPTPHSQREWAQTFQRHTGFFPGRRRSGAGSKASETGPA